MKAHRFNVGDRVRRTYQDQTFRSGQEGVVEVVRDRAIQVRYPSDEASHEYTEKHYSIDARFELIEPDIDWSELELQ